MLLQVGWQVFLHASRDDLDLFNIFALARILDLLGLVSLDRALPAVCWLHITPKRLLFLEKNRKIR